jgi:hypothetical protein
MRLEATQVLSVWDRAVRATPRERARLLLEVALPGRDADELDHLSLARRDRALTSLRAALFGRAFEGFVECPACAERLEVALELPESEPEALETRSFRSREGYEFRAPEDSDLDAIRAAPGIAAAMRMLLDRCCIAAPGNTPAEWSDTQVAEIEAGLAALHADDELHGGFTCAACGHTWESSLDPMTFLWEEVEALAIHLLQSVHRLAAAYGWSERDILALPAGRREAYLAFLDA